MFKLNLFEGAVFKPVGPSSCAGQVQRALQVDQPFAAPLTRYLDGFNCSDCVAFVKKIKSMFSEAVGLSKIEWVGLSLKSKRTAVEALFHLLHAASGAKRPWSGTEYTGCTLSSQLGVDRIAATWTVRSENERERERAHEPAR